MRILVSLVVLTTMATLAQAELIRDRGRIGGTPECHSMFREINARVDTVNAATRAPTTRMYVDFAINAPWGTPVENFQLANDRLSFELSTDFTNLTKEVFPVDLRLVSNPDKDSGGGSLWFDFGDCRDFMSTRHADHNPWWSRQVYPAGDANLDFVFDSSDLVSVFQQGWYELPWDIEEQGYFVWKAGDFNGDHRFDSSDLVEAFMEGQYEGGAPASAVPEPSAIVLLLIGGLSVFRRRM